MDVNLLTAAQTLSSNQPKFDQEAFDRAVLRGEKRRESALKLWATLHARANIQPFSGVHQRDGDVQTVELGW